MTPRIDGTWITEQIDRLGQISSQPAPVVTRVVFTEADLRGREFVRTLCREAHLQLREDPVGNLFARWPGKHDGLPAVATGSHIDAIPNAGRFDGPAGVLAGLEAIRSLQREGFQPDRAIELIVFTSEEPTRFGIGCLGSRLMAGVLDPDTADGITDSEGRPLVEIRREAGFTGSLANVRLAREAYAAFIELHIEQGPELERQNIPIGIVTAIAAPASVRIRLKGDGGHAGAVLMPQRRDAFLAACEIGLAVERAGLSTGSVDTVATTGVCRVFPGAINSIPSEVVLEIDIRDIDGPRRDGVLRSVELQAAEICVRRRIEMDWHLLNADAPASCDAKTVAALERACHSQRLEFQRMISRAYHDTLFVSQVAPSAMVFIPCRNGYSHRPDEYASPEAIAKGAAVLATALADLSRAS